MYLQTMATKIQKWGNSLAVRLPKGLVQKLRLEEGSEVEVREEKSRIVIQYARAQHDTVGKDSWEQFVIPTKKKHENVSGTIDQILYGVSSR